MKQDVTSRVVQCRECGAYFLPGIDGEGDLCDLCVAPVSDGDLPLLDSELVD